MTQCKYHAKLNSIQTVLCDFDFIASEKGEKIVFDNYNSDYIFNQYDYITESSNTSCEYDQKSLYNASIFKVSNNSQNRDAIDAHKYSVVVSNNTSSYKATLKCSDIDLEQVQHLLCLPALPPEKLTLEPRITVYLARENTFSSQDGEILMLNGWPSDIFEFGAKTGTYRFNNIPKEYAIAFHTKNLPIRYGGQFLAGIKEDEDGYEYYYYYGNVVLHIDDYFETLNYDTFEKGKMGKSSRIVYRGRSDFVGLDTFHIFPTYSKYTENALNNFDKLQIQKACDFIESVIIDSDTMELQIRDFTEEPSSPGGVAVAGGPKIYEALELFDGSSAIRVRKSILQIDSADLEMLRKSVGTKTNLYWHVVREILKCLGVGTIWNYAGYFKYVSLDEHSGAQYRGAHALREYNRLLDTNLNSLPIQTYTTLQPLDPDDLFEGVKEIAVETEVFTITQDVIEDGFVVYNDFWRPSEYDLQIPLPEDVGASATFTVYYTWGGHIAELKPDNGERKSLGGEIQPLYALESMTSIIDIDQENKFTRISVGFLHDLGYMVDYTKVK